MFNCGPGCDVTPGGVRATQVLDPLNPNTLIGFVPLFEQTNNGNGETIASGFSNSLNDAGPYLMNFSELGAAYRYAVLLVTTRRTGTLLLARQSAARRLSELPIAG